jgi:hypothetical protein
MGLLVALFYFSVNVVIEPKKDWEKGELKYSVHLYMLFIFKY